MPYPPQGAAAGITKLSELNIDVSKDWAAKKIENLGAPDTGDDAKRHDSVPAAHTLASHSTKAHAELTGVGASDHHVKTTSFADITDRAGASKLNWTAAKLLKGAGVGVDPTEIDVPGGLTFTELAGGSHTVTAALTWEDWDLSAIVPAGTQYVLVVLGADYTRLPCGARENGTALERKYGATNAPEGMLSTLLTKVDANRVIEIYSRLTDNIFQLAGYWS